VNSNVNTLGLDSRYLQSQDLISTHGLSGLTGETLTLQAAEAVQANIAPESHLAVHTDPHGMAADRFRLLCLGLRGLAGSGKIKTLLVTSALPQEGKSTIALNLAACLTDHGRDSVVLVETDFRHPSLVERLGLNPWPGLVQSLEDNTDPCSAIRRVDPLGFYLLPAGKIAVNPIELLNSSRFSSTLHRLRASADWIILDSPPANPVPDLLAIKPEADGCLWVLRAGATPREAVEEALQQVGQNRLLGIVLNEGQGSEDSYAQYCGYGIPRGEISLRLNS
jgi:capsular exopolysaccharide synthesis family protein